MKAFAEFLRMGGHCPEGGKKVVVVGAFGYLGAALVTRLAKEHAVFTCGRLTKRAAAEAFLSYPLMPVLAYSAEDLTADDAAGADAIIHLAGGGAPGGKMGDAGAALRDNVESAAHVASIAPPGCRLILASTIYVYGTGPRPFRESDTLAPDTLYGQCKAVAEAVWQQRGGTALRFAHIYGAGSGVDFGRDGVTERLARAATGGPPFTMHGDGSQQIDLVHIDDACEAVAAALRCPDLPPAVNVGGGAPVTVADLARVFGVDVPPSAQEIAAVLSEPVDLTAPPPNGIAGCFLLTKQAASRENGCYVVQDDREGRRWVRKFAEAGRALDISLARDVLGWAPRVTLAEGARGLVEMVRGGR